MTATKVEEKNFISTNNFSKIQFEKNPAKKNTWTLYELYYDSNSKNFLHEKEFVSDIELLSGTLFKKFKSNVADFICDMSKTLDDTFTHWFCGMIYEYIERGNDGNFIIQNVPGFTDFVKKYLDIKNYNYDSYINKSKSSKTSIVFLPEEIRGICELSLCLKLFSIFFNSTNLAVDDNVKKFVYSEFIKICPPNTLTKLYEMIKSRVLRSSVTDKFMWIMLEMSSQETPERYSLSMYNFLMKMLPTVDISKNPIPYFIKIVDDSIKWMIRSVFTEKFVYGEIYNTSSNITGSSFDKDTIEIYCCNDVLCKCSMKALEILEKEFFENIDKEENIDNDLKMRINKIENITSLMRLVTLPIINKVLDIPYKYLIYNSPKHVFLTGLLIGFKSKEYLGMYPVIYDSLFSLQNEEMSIVKSSYNIKNIEYVINEENSKIFGLGSPEMKYNIMSNLCGVISNYRKNSINIITGKEFKRKNFNEIEKDVIGFYLKFYSNDLDFIFKNIRNEIDKIL